MTKRDECFALAGGFMFMACDALIRGRYGWLAVALIVSFVCAVAGIGRRAA